MSRRFGLVLALVLWTLLVAAGAGAYAYHLGTLATLPAEGAAGAAVAPYYGWGFHPFFFPFGFLFPLLFVFLLIWLFRPRRWHGYGPGYGHWHGHGGPPRSREQAFEEWHRRAHGEAPADPDPGKSA